MALDVNKLKSPQPHALGSEQAETTMPCSGRSTHFRQTPSQPSHIWFQISRSNTSRCRHLLLFETPCRLFAPDISLQISRSISFQTSRSGHLVPDVSFRTFRSRHQVPDILFQTSCSKHLVPDLFPAPDVFSGCQSVPSAKFTHHMP